MNEETWLLTGYIIFWEQPCKGQSKIYKKKLQNKDTQYNHYHITQQHGGEKKGKILIFFLVFTMQRRQ